MKKFSVFATLAVLITALFAFSFVLAAPNGASTVSQLNSTTAAATNAQSNDAIAGNVTELTIFGTSTTQSWQGYFGNVSGAIELADSAGYVLYNWSLASPQGEVFASNNSGVSWTNVECFNYASFNVTGHELFYGIGMTDADGINETFLESVDHDAFNIGTFSFAANDCPAAFVYDSTGAGVDGNFEEALLVDNSSSSLVFTALLNENTAGFDGDLYDFEMLVVEDGHLGDASTTPYYFYVELE